MLLLEIGVAVFTDGILSEGKGREGVGGKGLLYLSPHTWGEGGGGSHVVFIYAVIIRQRRGEGAGGTQNTHVVLAEGAFVSLSLSCEECCPDHPRGMRACETKTCPFYIRPSPIT